MPTPRPARCDIYGRVSGLVRTVAQAVDDGPVMRISPFPSLDLLDVPISEPIDLSSVFVSATPGTLL